MNPYFRFVFDTFIDAIKWFFSPIKRFLRNRELKREQCADPQWKKETK